MEWIGIVVAIGAMGASYLVPVVTRKWTWMWVIAGLYGVAVAVTWRAAPQARMIVGFLALPFGGGLLVRITTAVVQLVSGRKNTPLILAIEIAGLLIIILQLVFGYPIVRF